MQSERLAGWLVASRGAEQSIWGEGGWCCHLEASMRVLQQEGVGVQEEPEQGEARLQGEGQGG